MRKLSDGQKNGQTGQSNFIGRCPTNVERPISTLVKCKIAVLVWVILSTWIRLFIVLISDKQNVVNIITYTVHKGWAKYLNFFFLKKLKNLLSNKVEIFRVWGFIYSKAFFEIILEIGDGNMLKHPLVESKHTEKQKLILNNFCQLAFIFFLFSLPFFVKLHFGEKNDFIE